MPREDYEERRQARIERYEARAEKAREEAARAWETERRIGDLIPMGQPILIGHHSEKHHRATIKRLHALADKACAEQRKAEHYEDRAQAARENRAVSSDDPEALDKLTARLEAARREHEEMKEVNAILRRTKAEGLEAQAAALTARGMDLMLAWRLVKPDFMGRQGYPFLANHSAKIKRLQDRITELQAAAEAESTETEITAPDPDGAEGRIILRENVEANRLQLLFPGKPDEETRKRLKRHGFRWAPSEGAWQRQLTNAARYAAQEVLEGLN